MSDTTQLKLPLLQASQAQKHVTVNEALSIIDSVVQLGVLDASLSAPPALPQEGDRYIVAASPTGTWSGKAKTVAVWALGTWAFLEPSEGWIAWDAAADAVLVYSNGAWAGLLGNVLAGGSISLLGIGIPADLTNRFAFQGTNALMTSLGSMDLTVNKPNAASDASITFKTGFNAHAILGLLGNNDLVFKVSSNGATFATPLTISAASGLVTSLAARADGLTLADGADPTKIGIFGLSGLSTGTTRTFSLPNTSGTLAVTGNFTQTFSGQTTFSSTSLTVGSNTATATYSLGSGATLSGSVKTLNLGTSGVSGSSTVVNIGSSVVGAGGTTVLNTPTVTFANTVTSVTMPQAAATAASLGLGGATGDATNRLSMNTPSVLLNNAGASIDVTVNKNATANDASFTFKDGFSARALVGLLGDNDFHFKVSPDGSSFRDALVIDRTSGKLKAGFGANLSPTAGDLAAPVDGDLWYNSTTGKFRARQASASIDLAGAGGGVSDGDKGDITISAGGTVWTVDPGAVTLAKMANIATAAFLGRNTAGTGAPEVLSTATAKTLLGLTGSNTGDQTITLTGNVTGSGTGSFATAIASGAVTYSKMQDISTTARIVGRFSAGAGSPEELTGTQATSLFDLFTSGLKGLAPASGGGAVNFLRADGTWAIPAAGGTGDVVGPVSATDNALARFDATTGKLLQTSVVTLDDNGVVTLPSAAVPSTPGTGKLSLFSKSHAGREMFAFMGATGTDTTLQPLLASNKLAWWSPSGNSSTVPAVQGMVAPTVLGTGSLRNVGTTNRATRMRRLGYVSAATAAAFAGHHAPAAQFTIGTGSGDGGFTYVTRFIVSDAALVSGARMFIGLRNAITTPTNVESNTLVNAIGVAALSTSGNLQIVYGGSTAQTAIDLGANFPANTLSADAYEVKLFASSGNQTIGYRVERLNTGDVATGTLSGTVGTQVPAATTFLGHTAYRTNNATLLAVGLDIVNVYIETEY